MAKKFTQINIWEKTKALFDEDAKYRNASSFAQYMHNLANAQKETRNRLKSDVCTCEDDRGYYGNRHETTCKMYIPF